MTLLISCLAAAIGIPLLARYLRVRQNRERMRAFQNRGRP